MQLSSPRNPWPSCPGDPPVSDRYRLWYWLIPAILLARLVTMALFPLVDTTEPRYAEIARLMMEHGDWITPWFEPGTPFWGKPPLSFWVQALSMQWFGVNELAVRFPSWVALVLTMALVVRFADRLWGRAEGLLSALVMLTMALGFVSAGAVMTDPFLLLGVTLSLLCVAEVTLAPSGRRAGWSFFIGLAIGLLAKGPLTLVLVGLPLIVWVTLERQWRALWQGLPWIRGSFLTVVLVVPWYIAAELKTPGFIDYFILGEHFRRFLDPGWQGDLYGSAHEQPHGMVWVFWLWATFPWGIVALTSLLWRGSRGRVRAAFRTSPTVRFLAYAAVAPMVFFTMSGNTLWTYVLPALPFFALLLAHLVARGADGVSAKRVRALALVAVLVPVLVTAAGLYIAVDEEVIGAEKTLIAHYRNAGASRPLYYLGEVPFSARFYLRETVRRADPGQLSALGESGESYFLAVRKHAVADVKSEVEGEVSVRYEGNRHTLLEVRRYSQRQGADRREPTGETTRTESTPLNVERAESPETPT